MALGTGWKLGTRFKEGDIKLYGDSLGTSQVITLGQAAGKPWLGDAANNYLINFKDKPEQRDALDKVCLAHLGVNFDSLCTQSLVTVTFLLKMPGFHQTGWQDANGDQFKFVTEDGFSSAAEDYECFLVTK